MTDTKIPRIYNGEPTQYNFFDGFTKAGFGMKVLYIIGFPMVSLLMEGYRYNKAKNNEAMAREDIERQERNLVSEPRSKTTIDSPSVDTPETGTKFQDETMRRKQEQSSRNV